MIDVIHIIIVSIIIIIVFVGLWVGWAWWYRTSLRRLVDLGKNAYRDQIADFNKDILKTHKIVAFYDECSLTDNVLKLVLQWQAIDPSKYLPSKKITADCKIYGKADEKLCTPYVTINGQNFQNLCIVY